MKKDFANENQKLYWELFSNGEKGFQGAPIFMRLFMEEERENNIAETKEIIR